MAQSKVNDFFNPRKSSRFGERQSAKRRKLQNLDLSSADPVQIEKQNTTPEPSKIENVSSTSQFNFLKIEDSKESLDLLKKNAPIFSGTAVSGAETSQQKKLGISSTTGNKTIARPRRSTRSKAKTNDASQKKITDLLSFGVQKFEVCKEEIKPELQDQNLKCIHPQEQSTEVTTSILDDHDRAFSGLTTPRKRMITNPVDEMVAPKTRVKKLAPRRLSGDDNQVGLTVAAKKNLDDSLNASIDSPSSSATDEYQVAEESSPLNIPLQQKSKSDLLELVSSMSDPPAAISPLHQTPERLKNFVPSKEMSPKLQILSSKLNSLSNMNNQAKRALKNCLKQSGKLDDIREKRKQLNSAISVSKKISASAAPESTPVKPSESTPVKCSEVSKAPTQNLPAHQRYEHLVDPAPELVLPFHYRLLDAAFQATDHIVSMMHNRSEMCTFSKLKAAVQNITRKNYEEKSLGQIIEVVPQAYDLRQERNVPIYGQKSFGYHLTVEPRLTDTKDENSIKTKEGKPLFTSSMLVSRKQEFKNKLVSRVLQHHKTFLASLGLAHHLKDDKPLQRWHPKFQLDKVPEVPQAPLPQAPNIKVYNTAKDVLQKQKGKLEPNVEQALSNVANANKLSESSKIDGTSTTSTPAPPPVTKNSPSMKGIPPALLAKIQAKEAARTLNSLTRDPKEDKKTRMMGHLPDIMRIVRAYFVTEKKAVLPLERVHKKLHDNYRTGISLKDVEVYLALLKDLAPELITQVEVQRGKFIKLDKNVDIQAVSSRIMAQVKSRR